MKPKWYVQIGDHVYGPHTAAKLKEGAASGRLDRDTLVRRGETGEWVRAARIRGLFPDDHKRVRSADEDRSTAVSPSVAAISILLLLVISAGLLSALLAHTIAGSLNG